MSDNPSPTGSQGLGTGSQGTAPAARNVAPVSGSSQLPESERTKRVSVVQPGDETLPAFMRSTVSSATKLVSNTKRSPSNVVREGPGSGPFPTPHKSSRLVSSKFDLKMSPEERQEKAKSAIMATLNVENTESTHKSARDEGKNGGGEKDGVIRASAAVSVSANPVSRLSDRDKKVIGLPTDTEIEADKEARRKHQRDIHRREERARRRKIKLSEKLVTEFEEPVESLPISDEEIESWNRGPPELYEFFRRNELFRRMHRAKIERMREWNERRRNLLELRAIPIVNKDAMAIWATNDGGDKEFPSRNHCLYRKGMILHQRKQEAALKEMIDRIAKEQAECTFVPISDPKQCHEFYKADLAKRLERSRSYRLTPSFAAPPTYRGKEGKRVAEGYDFYREPVYPDQVFTHGHSRIDKVVNDGGRQEMETFREYLNLIGADLDEKFPADTIFESSNAEINKLIQASIDNDKAHQKFIKELEGYWETNDPTATRPSDLDSSSRVMEYKALVTEVANEYYRANPEYKEPAYDGIYYVAPDPNAVQLMINRKAPLDTGLPDYMKRRLDYRQYVDRMECSEERAWRLALRKMQKIKEDREADQISQMNAEKRAVEKARKEEWLDRLENTSGGPLGDLDTSGGISNTNQSDGTPYNANESMSGGGSLIGSKADSNANNAFSSGGVSKDTLGGADTYSQEAVVNEATQAYDTAMGALAGVFGGGGGTSDDQNANENETLGENTKSLGATTGASIGVQRSLKNNLADSTSRSGLADKQGSAYASKRDIEGERAGFALQNLANGFGNMFGTAKEGEDESPANVAPNDMTLKDVDGEVTYETAPAGNDEDTTDTAVGAGNNEAARTNALVADGAERRANRRQARRSLALAKETPAEDTPAEAAIQKAPVISSQKMGSQNLGGGQTFRGSQAMASATPSGTVGRVGQERTNSQGSIGQGAGSDVGTERGSQNITGSENIKVSQRVSFSQKLEETTDDIPPRNVDGEHNNTADSLSSSANPGTTRLSQLRESMKWNQSMNQTRNSAANSMARNSEARISSASTSSASHRFDDRISAVDGFVPIGSTSIVAKTGIDPNSPSKETTNTGANDEVGMGSDELGVGQSDNEQLGMGDELADELGRGDEFGMGDEEDELGTGNNELGTGKELGVGDEFGFGSDHDELGISSELGLSSDIGETF